MSEHKHLNPGDVTSESDPVDVAETIIDDANADDLADAYEIGDEANEAGVPLPEGDEAAKMFDAVDAAEDREADREYESLVDDLSDLF